MKIALAQINPVVGDLEGNREAILDAARRAAGMGAELALLPELAVTGYPPRDLLDYPPFVEKNLEILSEIARRAPLPCLVGHVARNPAPTGKGLFNAASLVAEGRIAATYHKMLLPTYDVFDEARYFEPGRSPRVVELGGRRLGVTICEDIWNEADFLERPYAADPVALVVAAGAEVLLNISASPWQAGKLELRAELFARQAREARRPLLFCNQVGGNDELIFDGASLVLDGEGRLVAQCRSFECDLVVVDTERLPLPRPLEAASRPAQVLAGLELGLADYARKTGFQKALVGLSGGIDSAVTAAIAARALSPARVTGVSMPSRFSSPGSLDDAQSLAESLGIARLVLPIEPIHAAYLSVLAGVFSGLPADATEENVQARVRGALLMALSNKRGDLLLTTGNKSELAVGYCTLYGDMCGGLALISDVPKTMVYQLAHEINRQAARPPIPQASIAKPPSAELRPNQTDQDTLPPYDLLDAILEAYLEERLPLREIVAKGHPEATVRWVLERVNRNEYKRWQAAPGLRVTSKAFGIGRRMPIAQRYRLA